MVHSRCVVEGCSKHSFSRLKKRCIAHARLLPVFRECAHPKCKFPPTLRGPKPSLCVRHATETCNYLGCSSSCYNHETKYCYSHCIKLNHKICAYEGCNVMSVRSKLCKRHRENYKRPCFYCKTSTFGTVVGSNICATCSVNRFKTKSVSFTEIAVCRLLKRKLGIKKAIHNDFCDGKVVLNQFLPHCEPQKLAFVDFFVKRQDLTHTKFSRKGIERFGIKNFHGLIMQYDGPYHDDPSQSDRDNKRRTHLVQHGYIVLVSYYQHPGVIVDFATCEEVELFDTKELRKEIKSLQIVPRRQNNTITNYFHQ